MTMVNVKWKVHWMLREAICRVVGHRPVDTGRRSGVKSCRRCGEVEA